jgi:hypothetical protein
MSMLRDFAAWGRRTGLDSFVLWKYRPRLRQMTEIVQQESNVPARDAARLVRHGRSVNFAYGPDGQMRLRRRAKQAAREFGIAFSWRAKSQSDQHVPAIPRHRKRIFQWFPQ